MKLTRRTLLYSIAATACSACNTTRPPSRRAASRLAHKSGSDALPLIGYGLVNKWFTVNPENFASLLTASGCTLTGLEYMAWFDERGPKGSSIRYDLQATSRFVAAMRRHGIETLISVVNWNGEAQRAQPDAWYYQVVNEIVDKIGREGVLLLPVSEPDSSGKSVEWQQYAREHWPGTLVLNGPGGRGDPVIGGAKYIDWHWCEDFDATTCKPAPFLNNTDCGPVLNPGPERTYRMAKAALGKQAHFHVYDHHGEAVDERTVAALGRAVSEHLAAAPQSHAEASR